MVSLPPSANASQAADRTLRDVIAAVQAGDYERASHLAGTILALGMHHPMVYNARALDLEQKGQYREALVEFNLARSLAPNDPNILVAIGACLTNLNQPFDAIKSFESAIAADPQHAQAHYRKGWTLEMLGDRAEARKMFERAVALNPDHADALASLASSLAMTGEPADARPFAERALRLNPDQPTAIVALGCVALAEMDYAAAEMRFRRVTENSQLTLRANAVVHGLLGDALDALDRPDEAFAAYRFENNEMRKLYAKSYASERRPREFSDRIAAFLETSPPEIWKGDMPVAGFAPANHVFVLGFPCAGDPALLRDLASRPDIGMVEGQDLLAEPAQTYLTSDAGLRRLAMSGNEEWSALRAAYWERVRDCGADAHGKTFIDSYPMNTVKLPLIARLFPDAKIVFAMRDPRDVILDCYRGHFEINPTTFEFLTLDDAVDFYASVMRVGVAARDRLPLAFHLHRAEDFTPDSRNTPSALYEFLGVPARPASPDAGAAQRMSSAGAWRRYRSHLSPVLPLLRPWAERFGYPAE